MTKFYKNMKALCDDHSEKSKKVIDEFLLYYIAHKGNFKKKIDLVEKKYKHIIRDMPKAFFPTISAEFVVGKALMKDGLLNKYIDHPEINQISAEEKEFLKSQLVCPWRYVFGRILKRQEDEFFLMRDEFLGDDLLIYSQGIEMYFQNGHQDSLYFVLLGNNGECWQTFGLIAPFLSFDINDVYIYGTEVFADVEDDESFMRSVYRDPYPYFMLLCGQQYPTVISENSILKHFFAEDEIRILHTEKLKDYFKIRSNKKIKQLALGDWSLTPHFALAYFIEKENTLCRYAMTQEGFDAITNKLIEAGLPVKREEDYAVGLSMANTIERILKRDFLINPYDKHFTDTNESNVTIEEIDQINKLLGLLIPFINSGTQPDLEQLALECGMHLNEATDIYESMQNKYNSL